MSLGTPENSTIQKLSIIIIIKLEAIVSETGFELPALLVPDSTTSPFRPQHLPRPNSRRFSDGVWLEGRGLGRRVEGGSEHHFINDCHTSKRRRCFIRA